MTGGTGQPRHAAVSEVSTTPALVAAALSAGGGGHPSYDSVLTTAGTTPEYVTPGEPHGGGALGRGASAAAAVNGDVDGGGYVAG